MWERGINFKLFSGLSILIFWKESLSSLKLTNLSGLSDQWIPDIYLPDSISQPSSHKCMPPSFLHKIKGLSLEDQHFINWDTLQDLPPPFINPIYSPRLGMLRILANATQLPNVRSPLCKDKNIIFLHTYIEWPKEFAQTGHFILHIEFLSQPSHLPVTDVKSNYQKFSSLNWCKFVIWMFCWPEVCSPTETPI